MRCYCKNLDVLELAKTTIRSCWSSNTSNDVIEKLVFPTFSLFEEHKPDLSSSDFNISQYYSLLKTKELGSLLMYRSSLPSTQEILYDKLPGIQMGLVCVADVQVNGKGRGGNIWTSPEGCLMFSYKAAFKDGSTLPFVQYLVSIAIIRAIKSISGLALTSVNIKWPNDIYVNKGIKIGGILCQSTYQMENFDLTIGVGINVKNKEPTTCLADLVDDSKVSREELLANFFYQFENILEQFEKEGFSPFRSEYTSYWLHSDQRVSVQEGTGEEKKNFFVSIKGIADDGYLLAVDDFGRTLELFPDGNSFDFLNGLIVKK